MQWFKNISLGKKLIGGFLLASLITAVIGGVGYIRISSNMDDVEEMVTSDVQLMKEAEELQILALLHRRYEKDFLLNIGKKEKQKGYIAKFNKVSVKTEGLLRIIAKEMNNNDFSPTIKDAATNAQSSYAKYKQGIIGLSKTIWADDTLTPQKGNALMKPFKDHIYIFESNVKILLAAALAKVDAKSKTIISSGKSSRIIIGFLLIVGFVLSLLLGFVLKALITGPIIAVVNFANNMADGDLTQKIDLKQKDEIGTLINSLNHMSENLKDMFLDVNKSTQTLSSSSSELSTISDQITSNSQHTAAKSNTVAAAAEEMNTNMNSVVNATELATSNIQMVVAAVEEMTATIQEIANNTAKGSEITKSAVIHAKDVSLKVDALGKAAEEINQVTGTIADISEQTNLLALNATIEAARAGEAGKGFAVVAGEIKELANQTASATSEINGKISEVQKTTAESVSAIESIVSVINEINDVVATVAASIEEQSATTQEISSNVTQAAQGVQEINDNINQISAVTAEVTQNVSEVSQAAEESNTGSEKVHKSAEELTVLAGNLNKMVGKFKI
ncbi:MAG: HAMP domain-containing protein [Desulfobacterales bacterium]|nr:HAMP domain-containing protein [Desulfobacterales bacterium]